MRSRIRAPAGVTLLLGLPDGFLESHRARWGDSAVEDLLAQRTRNEAALQQALKAGHLQVATPEGVAAGLRQLAADVRQNEFAALGDCVAQPAVGMYAQLLQRRRKRLHVRGLKLQAKHEAFARQLGSVANALMGTRAIRHAGTQATKARAALFELELAAVAEREGYPRRGAAKRIVLHFADHPDTALRRKRSTVLRALKGLK